MDAMYEYRYQTHALLLKLDACNAGLMALVARQQIGTARWEEALLEQQVIFKQWQSHLRTGMDWQTDTVIAAAPFSNQMSLRPVTAAR